MNLIIIYVFWMNFRMKCLDGAMNESLDES